jgi:hypothetical protein
MRDCAFPGKGAQAMMRNTPLARSVVATAVAAFCVLAAGIAGAQTVVTTRQGILPTGTESYACDVNNAGVIVGTSTTGSPYGWHAVMWKVTASGGGRKPRR